MSRITGTLHDNLCTWLNSCRNEKFLFYVQYSPPPENCAVYEIRWKNMAELDRPNMATHHGAKIKDAICMPGN